MYPAEDPYETYRSVATQAPRRIPGGHRTERMPPTLPPLPLRNAGSGPQPAQGGGRRKGGRAPAWPGIDARGRIAGLPAAARARRWFSLAALVWVFLGMLVGAAALVAALTFFAPQPAPVAGAPGTGVLSVTLNDAFLNANAPATVSGATLPIALTSIQTHILPGDAIAISADTAVLGMQRQLTANAQVSTADGHLALHIVRAQLGALPLPSAITSALERALNQRLAQSTASLLAGGSGYAIAGLSTASGQLTLRLAPAH